MSNNSDLRFLSFNKYVRQPIREYTSKGWVLNGVNNSFYDYIIARYYGSVTISSVIDSYINLIYGKGLTEKGGDIESQEWKDFLKVFSKKDQKKVISDYEIFGEFSVQIIRQKGNRSQLAQIIHLDKSKVVPSIEDELGNINSYWYSRDWSKQWQEGYIPDEFPALGKGTGKDIEIYVGSPYKVGKDYFKDPDYLSALPYAEFEEEVANYYLKYIKNGLSLGNIINVPNSYNWSDAIKDKYERNIKDRLTGSENANTHIISFNGGEENTTIESIKNEYAHKQWDFLTVEARQQIMTSHKVTNTGLVGVSTSSGFSSTADELDEAEHQLMKRVISPKQNFITESIREILDFFGQDRELEFIPLTDKAKVLEDAVEIKTGVELSSECDCVKKKVDFEQYALDPPTGYELFQTDFNLEETEIEFASTANSEQDTKKWKIRYAYNIGTSKTPIGASRDFCNRMMKLSDSGKVFRKEDIDIMSSNGVNGQFAHEGGKYNIFLYGGGVNCYHRWERRIFKKKTQEDGSLYGGNATQNTTKVNVNEARRQGAKLPKNDKDVAIAEIDKPNKGSLK